MRILVLCNKPPYPPVDGGSIASWGLIQSLAHQEHQLTVMAMNTRKHHVTPFEIPENIQHTAIIHLVEVPAPINITGALKNLLFSNLPYNAERFIDRKVEKKIIGLLSHQSFDIIQLEGLYLCPYIPVIRKNSTATIVYRSHNIEHEIWERTLAQAHGTKKAYLKILVGRLRKFELSFLNQYDLLVPITCRDLEKLNHLGNKMPALALPAGIDLNDVEPFDPSNSKNLFFIGALDWAPNQEGLIWFLDHCWPTVRKQYPGITLTIAGRNAPGWLIKKIDQPNICFSGEVPDSKAFMKKHGIMIAPLLSGSGMRIKIIEAMSMKKPIVTSNIGCEGIEASHMQDIMIGNSPEQFVHCIGQLIDQPQLAATISENCFTFVQNNYSNRNLAKKLVNFYQEHTL